MHTPELTAVHPTFVALALRSLQQIPAKETTINATGIFLSLHTHSHHIPLQEIRLLSTEDECTLQLVHANSSKSPPHTTEPTDTKISASTPAARYRLLIPTDHYLHHALPRLATPSKPLLQHPLALNISDTHYLIHQNCPQLPISLIETWTAPLTLSLSDAWPDPCTPPSFACKLRFTFTTETSSSIKESNPGYLSLSTLTRKPSEISNHAPGELFYDIESLLLFSALIPLLPACWTPLSATPGPNFRSIIYTPIPPLNSAAHQQLSPFVAYYLQLNLTHPAPTFELSSATTAPCAQETHRLISFNSLLLDAAKIDTLLSEVSPASGSATYKTLDHILQSLNTYTTNTLLHTLSC